MIHLHRKNAFIFHQNCTLNLQFILTVYEVDVFNLFFATYLDTEVFAFASSPFQRLLDSA